MNEIEEGYEEIDLNKISSIFSKILGVKVKAVEKYKDEDEGFFNYTVSALEESDKSEEEVFKASGLDLSVVTEPLWEIIEMFFIKEYGYYTKNVIFDWIHNRYDEDGNLLPFTITNDDGSVTEFSIKSVKELFKYVKKIK